MVSDAQDGAPALLDLPDAVLVQALVLAGRRAMLHACASCRALRRLAASDMLWSEYNATRYPRYALLSPARLGARSHRELAVALAALEPYAGLYVVLSEYPWGGLVAVTLELGGADGARLVGRLLRTGVAEVAEVAEDADEVEGAPAGEAAQRPPSPVRPAVRAHATAASDELFAVSLRGGLKADATAAAVGLRVGAGGGGERRGWLASTRGLSAVERARAAELAPAALGVQRRRASLSQLLNLGGLAQLGGLAATLAGADRRELLWPWLVDAGQVAALFPHIWPVAGCARLHDGDLLALQLAPNSAAPPAAAPPAAAPPAAAGSADGDSGGARVVDEGPSARRLLKRLDLQMQGHRAAADADATAEDSAPRPHTHTARSWAHALAAHGVELPASARGSGSGSGGGPSALAEADGDESARGPFVLLARLHASASAPAAAAARLARAADGRAGWSSASEYPVSLLEHPALSASVRALLPALGLYASDYGALYAHRRVECVQLRVVTFSEGEQGGAAADWSLRAIVPAAPDAAQGLAEGAQSGGDGGQFESGSTYLLALKVQGDLHVPMGACTFAVELLDRHGRAPAVQLLAGGGARWAGWGCLAFAGFRSHSFTAGALTVHDAPPAPAAARGGSTRTRAPPAPAEATVAETAARMGPRASFRSLGSGPANESFSFAWAGESSHVYHRLRIDDSTFRLTDAPAEP